MIRPIDSPSFRITDHVFDDTAMTVELRYALGTASFVEIIEFRNPPVVREPEPVAFDRALTHLHVAAGTSYYKTAAPEHIEIEVPLGEEELALHRHLYDDGLREFAVRNDLAIPLRQRFTLAGGRAAASDPRQRSSRGRVAVPIGGGKDSLVLLEALRPLDPVLLCVNPKPLIADLAAISGMELIDIRRHIDPKLFEMNAAGALNGHVPITAIVSLIAVVASFLYDIDSIAMAIESSADEETRLVDGVQVNHQYSKSSACEDLLVDTITDFIDSSLAYGSPLRPYSELAIASAFASLSGYHSTFCSCNTAFRQNADPSQRWCGQCPKCRFVYVMLAPSLDRRQLRAIFGVDLLDDPDQITGFAALMSDVDKPYECVGERREVAVALHLLAGAPGWKEAAVVQALAAHADRLADGAATSNFLAPNAKTERPTPDIAEHVAAFMARHVPVSL